MSKKKGISKEDINIWQNYIKNPLDIIDKDNSGEKNTKKNSRFKYDLHGYNLLAANKKVKEIILLCVKNKYQEVLLITGKGIHSNTEKDILYSLNHLKINNLALHNITKQFFGLEFTYGGYVGKIKDFYDEGVDFSNGIIEGLKGAEGFVKLNDPVKQEFYSNELSLIEANLVAAKENVQAWLDSEIKRLKAKHGE